MRGEAGHFALKCPPRGQSRIRGFTLIELMTVVAILGIIAALAIGSLGPTIRRVRVTGAAEGVAEALAFARSMAISGNRCVRVEMVRSSSAPRPRAPIVQGVETGDGLRLVRWLDVNCEASNAARYENVEYIDTFPAPSDVVLAFAAAAGNPLVWRANGRLMGESTITLRVANEADASVAASVEVAANGPICVFHGLEGGSCP